MKSIFYSANWNVECNLNKTSQLGEESTCFGNAIETSKLITKLSYSLACQVPDRPAPRCACTTPSSKRDRTAEFTGWACTCFQVSRGDEVYKGVPEDIAASCTVAVGLDFRGHHESTS